MAEAITILDSTISGGYVKRVSYTEAETIVKEAYLRGNLVLDKTSGQIIEQLQNQFGELVTKPVRFSVRLSEAPAWGQTIYEYAGKEKVSKDYADLSEVIE